ncbi:MAG: MarR family transcriptional regulator [Chloroflexota bacterium]
MNEFDARTCDPLLLSETLRKSTKADEESLDVALAGVGLSATRWAALRSLAEAGDQMPLSRIAEMLSCARSNATQLVDRLEAGGLLIRVTDPDDRRSVSARLTGEGRNRYAAGLDIMREYERSLLGDYTPEERLLLWKLLNRLGG